MGSGDGRALVSHMQIYSFRNCLLNTVERRVMRHGQLLDLTPRTFDVLQLLVERSGEIVTKDEMLGKVWDGSFVEEANLPVHISKLRSLLGETRAEHFIETVHGTGYRFVSPVECVTPESWKTQNPSANGHLNGHAPHTSSPNSIAVLPFRNGSDDAEIDYLSDGLTESLINGLAGLPNLKVLARDTVFRYKNKDVDAKQVGETLGVSMVLTGRIRMHNDDAAVSVDLVRVDDGTQIWGAKFDRPFSEIVRIQKEITSAVTDKIMFGLGAAVPIVRTNGFTQDSESYRLYLKGKYFAEKHSVADFYKAIECFEKSVSYDPTNVLSYVETAECYVSLYCFDQISRAAALEKLNPLLQIISGINQTADVVQSLFGQVKMYFDWKFEEAETHFQNALDANPNSIVARYRYASLLEFTGRFSDSLCEMNKMTQVDPLSLRTYTQMGRSFYRMGRYENAVMYLNEALELAPADHLSYVLLGAVLTELHRFEEAFAMFNKSLELQPNLETLSMIGYANAVMGETEKARQILAEITQRALSGSLPTMVARIYVALGETDTAFKFLEKAFIAHEADLIALRCDPRWKPISNNNRFKALIAKFGLPGRQQAAGFTG